MIKRGKIRPGAAFQDTIHCYNAHRESGFRILRPLVFSTFRRIDKSMFRLYDVNAQGANPGKIDFPAMIRGMSCVPQLKGRESKQRVSIFLIWRKTRKLELRPVELQKTAFP